MKRLQIYIEERSDDALAQEAAREGVSKASIIRRLVAEHVGGTGADDPIDVLVGTFADDPTDVDATVYGP
ncbi:CopG family transcriptional regulator [Iamia sp.]|uniref:ribbon-helix-helix domain-containing protein n=1 Tax=Iamia sp. TaxID=2722710 RepID=UPI002CAF1B55|nr:CopG family transcriptional regulator [Iamia sp.]HXH56520.1 CopG family transcriptional regulator [Iamia sp.]